MESPRSVPALTNDLLEEIFLRIGSPADLVRASAASVNFRRLITDPPFMRRYRSIHPPLLLGLLYCDGRGFQPAEAPHPSAALARASDFSFDGTGGRWRLWDVRDGRLLLRHADKHYDCEYSLEWLRLPTDLAVCDPLARRCLLLPPIPDGLLASVQVQKRNLRSFRAFLLPSGDEEDDDTSFRVIARTVCKEMVVAFIFSSSTAHWSFGTSVSWDALSIPPNHRDVVGSSSYAYGCFYWKIWSGNKWLKFNTRSMEFSAIDLAPGREMNCVTIIGEAGEGRLVMFSIISSSSLYRYIIWQIEGERFDQLKMDNTIPLPVGYWYCIHTPYEGHIFISRYPYQSTGVPDACFSLEIKTLKIERVCQPGFPEFYPYFGFLPSMSRSRI